MREAAGLLGTSTEAVRKRAARGSLRSEKRGDGRVVVWVDDDRTEGGREALENGDALVEVLTEQVSYLKAQLDIRTEELRRKDHIIAGLVDRVPELEAPDRGPGEAEDVGEGPGRGAAPEHRQEATDRPWWRKVFGG